MQQVELGLHLSPILAPMCTNVPMVLSEEALIVKSLCPSKVNSPVFFLFCPTTFLVVFFKSHCPFGKKGTMTFNWNLK